MLRWGFALLVLPLLILLHLLVAPYTKVEESFNIQAVHDILTFGIPTKNVAESLKSQYDHMTFRGAVPRTFVGALVFAGFSRPLIWLNGAIDRQRLVRGVLGLFNAASLVTYAIGVRKAFGTTTCFWFIALQASQFHIIYYASRTLPNMFAFGISTFALRLFLPDHTSPATRLKRIRLAYYLLTLATVIFRSELALLVASHALYTLSTSGITIRSQIATLRTVLLPAGLLGTVLGLAISIPIDTFFWQSRTPLWPELSAFLSNVFPSSADGGLGASAWGTSPWHWYFTSALPRLLLNPLSLPLITHYTLTRPTTTRSSSTGTLLYPALGYIALYSLLPHKETRFLFPVVPPLTALAAVAATHVTNRRHRSTHYRVGTYALVLSTAATFFLAHAVLLPLSAFSYSGAHALNALHSCVLSSNDTDVTSSQSTTIPVHVHVHFDNLALQTGVTRFLQIPPPPLPGQPNTNTTTTTPSLPWIVWTYDKSDPPPATLLDPFWWEAFDYAVVEDPGLAIGAWEVVDRVYGLKVSKSTPDTPTKKESGRGSGSTEREIKRTTSSSSGSETPLRGLAPVLKHVYGQRIASLYSLFRDVVGWRWPSPWWSVNVELVERLFVLRNMGGARGVVL